MFIAGYVPALMITAALMLTVAIISQRRKYKPSHAEPVSAGVRFRYFINALPALFLPLGIIMGCVWACLHRQRLVPSQYLLCTLIGFFVYRELGIADVPLVLRETVQGTSSVMFIIIGAMVFGYYLTLERIPHTVAAALIDLTDHKLALLLFINLLLLITVCLLKVVRR